KRGHPAASGRSNTYCPKRVDRPHLSLRKMTAFFSTGRSAHLTILAGRMWASKTNAVPLTSRRFVSVAKAPTTKDVKALLFAFLGKTLFNGYSKAQAALDNEFEAAEAEGLARRWRLSRDSGKRCKRLSSVRKSGRIFSERGLAQG